MPLGVACHVRCHTAEMAPAELLIVVGAVVIGAFVKAVTGMGLPLIAIPIAAIFVDLDDAVVVMALPNMLANAVLAWQERAAASSTRDLPVLTATGIVGAVIGTLVFINVAEEPLIVALLAAIVVYVITFFAAPDFRVGPDRSRRWSPIVGTVAGLFQGAIGISGPIVGSWVHSYRLPRSAHVLSVTVLFFVTGSTQFVVLIGGGELDGRIVATVAACLPVLLTIRYGTRLRNRLSRRRFDLAIVALLTGSAVALAVRLAA